MAYKKQEESGVVNLQEELKPNKLKKNKPALIFAVLLATFLFISFILLLQNWILSERVKNISRLLTPSPTPSKALDPTSGWQTYTNSQYGYEIKLPANWKHVEHSSNFDYLTEFQSSSDLSSIRIHVHTDSVGKNLSDFLKEVDRISKTAYEGKPSVKVIRTTVKILNGVEVIEREEELIAAGVTSIVTYIPTSKYIYSVSTSGANYKESEVYKYYILVLSTLKFAPKAEPTKADLQSISIAYKYEPTWETYTDEIAGFSMQYNLVPEGEFQMHLKLESSIKGEKAVIFSCNTPTSGPMVGKEICLSGYTIEVKNNYSGGSRREWLRENYTKDLNCSDIYYANVNIAGTNAIMSTSNCGSFGETYVAIPKGNKMIVYSFSGFSYDKKTEKFIIPDYYKNQIATFKFIN